MIICYRAILEPDDDAIRVECPVLPELNTFGDDEADALHHAVDAAETVLAFYMSQDEAIPPGDAEPDDPRAIRLPLLSSLKLELYTACRAAGVTRAELARRLGWHREQVDRLFRLHHASRLDQLETAARAVGLEIALDIRPLALAAA